ncbi:hypothetical protein ACF1GT_20105 [Streptomyces sp. NPDC014636]|uniref:hypothetical protein n=1 Tax=Streptomyces sp. NPDC014636 TaxID=3364876 RepID=UPI0036FED013
MLCTGRKLSRGTPVAPCTRRLTDVPVAAVPGLFDIAVERRGNGLGLGYDIARPDVVGRVEVRLRTAKALALRHCLRADPLPPQDG